MNATFTTCVFLCVSIILKSQPVLPGLAIANGGTIYGNVMQGQDGKLYGTTATTGKNNVGVIFSFDPATSVYTTLKDLDRANGAYPTCCLFQTNDGKLYGTTQAGGKYEGGVIFSFDPATLVYTKLKNFRTTDGYNSAGGLMQAKDGKLYGMTSQGGNNGFGVIFSFDPATLVYTKIKDMDFNSGYGNSGRLLQLSNGKLYGTTLNGGSTSATGAAVPYGVIFSLDPATAVYTKLKVFDYTSGTFPNPNLTLASDGKLYGTTAWGGAINFGVIFSFDPATSVYTNVKDLKGGINGKNPNSELLQANDGKLYGTTQNGGKGNAGVLFSFDPVTSVYTKVQDFKGSNPLYNVILEVRNTSANLITSALSANNYSPGSTITVGYTAKGTYNAANVFTAQLSDASGSFASPVNIGSIASTTSGVIQSVIPANTIAGTEYRIRVVASDAMATGTDNGSDITINNAPVAVYRINAGGLQVSNSIGIFAADTLYSLETNNTYSTTTAIAGTTDEEMYQTERFGASNTLSYSLPVSNGNYNVILHFAEIYWKAPGQRIFDVSIEGNKVLDNYDIFKKAGGYTATTESFPVSVTDGVLNINFSSLPADGGVDHPKVSAIEVLNTGTNPIVTSFTLVNAVNNKDIQTIINGSVLNLATLPSRSVIIRANTSPASVDSVVFTLDGAQTVTKTEKTTPYAFPGDDGGMYTPWMPVVGGYTLTATPYQNLAINGVPGVPLSISFTVINQATPDITVREAIITPEINLPVATAFTAFPNPNTSGYYTVMLPKQLQGNVSYTLTTINGTRLAGGMLLLAKPTSSLQFNFAREMMSSGQYYLILQGKDVKGQVRLMRVK